MKIWRIGIAIVLFGIGSAFYLTESRAPISIHRVEMPLQLVLLVGCTIVVCTIRGATGYVLAGLLACPAGVVRLHLFTRLIGAFNPVDLERTVWAASVTLLEARVFVSVVFFAAAAGARLRARLRAAN